jgi:hypothetical protein
VVEAVVFIWLVQVEPGVLAAEVREALVLLLEPLVQQTVVEEAVEVAVQTTQAQVLLVAQAAPELSSLKYLTT